jgi:hypothetical protein
LRLNAYAGCERISKTLQQPLKDGRPQMPATGPLQERHLAAELGPVLRLQDFAQEGALFAVEAELDRAAWLQFTIALDCHEQRLGAGFLARRVTDDDALDALTALDPQPGALAGPVLRAEPLGDDAI